MFEVDIPGFGQVKLKHLASDFTGTLSMHGKLVPGVRELLNRVAAILDVHVLTADTFGTARSELAGVDARFIFLRETTRMRRKKRMCKTSGRKT